MTEATPVNKREVRRERRAGSLLRLHELPLLLGLLLTWMLLWREFSWLSLVSGVVVSIIAMRLFYLPPVILAGLAQSDVPRRRKRGGKALTGEGRDIAILEAEDDRRALRLRRAAEPAAGSLRQDQAVRVEATPASARAAATAAISDDGSGSRGGRGPPTGRPINPSAAFEAVT